MVGDHALPNDALTIDPTDKDVNAKFIPLSSHFFGVGRRRLNWYTIRLLVSANGKEQTYHYRQSLSQRTWPGQSDASVSVSILSSAAINSFLTNGCPAYLVRQHDAAMVRAGLRQAHKITDIVDQHTTSTG